MPSDDELELFLESYVTEFNQLSVTKTSVDDLMNEIYYHRPFLFMSHILFFLDTAGFNIQTAIFYSELEKTLLGYAAGNSKLHLTE